MIIIKYDVYKDGGTVEITTDEGVFCFDGRLKSETKDSLYYGYPRKDNSNIMENQTELKKEIIESLKNFKHPFYDPHIGSFISKNTDEL
jgi:hypothetical protein